MYGLMEGNQAAHDCTTTPQQTHIQHHQLSQHNRFVLHMSYIRELLMFEWIFGHPTTDISTSFGYIV